MRLALASVLILVFSSFSMVGCVSQTEADRTGTAYRKQLELNEELRHQIDELNARIRLLEGDIARAKLSESDQIASLRQERDLLVSQRNELMNQNRSLQAQIASLEERIRTMPREPEVVEKIVVQQAITPELDKALKDFASQYPDIAEYDASKGMIKLRSDVTFDLGSDRVKQEAARSLGQLARILNAPEASGYEIRVVGHTDSVPIRRAETLRRHPDNWYLSVHRAVAVREVLQAANVPATRLSVAGYGPYRPLVANTASGAEPNRRVEIYLVPMSPLDQRLEQSIQDQGRPAAGAAEIAPAEDGRSTDSNTDINPVPLK